MNLVPQNDPALNPKIQRYGCRFRSLLAIGEFHAGRILTPEMIEDAYGELVPSAMNENCRCNERENLISRWSMRALGSVDRCYQIGVAYGKVEFWPAARIYTLLEGITHHKGEPGYENEEGRHYRLGDRAGALLFDPFPMAVIKEEKRVLIYQIV